LLGLRLFQVLRERLSSALNGKTNATRYSSVAVLVQPAECDSAIVGLIFENRQRDSAMLFYFLVPWILVTLLLASPLPDILWARNIGA
jgi:hypothetical protein